MEKLIGKDINELTSIAEQIGQKPFVAKQIAHWLYTKRIHSIDEMSNLSKQCRNKLSERYNIGLKAPIKVTVSNDGTKKYLFDVGIDTPEYIESVYIPDSDRATLCVSTQAGCRMGCKFCFTGGLGFHRNLTSSEILNQIFSIPESNTLTNIVYMGMGEPMDNIDNVLKSLSAMTSSWGCGWSGSRITVSTVGLIPEMKRFLSESDCHLAISLHNPFDDERLSIMPIQRAYPISKVLDSLDDNLFKHQRRLSFEYICFAGANDTMRHARELVRRLGKRHCRINLIKYHNDGTGEFIGSSQQQMEWLCNYLNDNGIRTTIRRSRGEDIMAACGMLVAKETKES